MSVSSHDPNERLPHISADLGSRRLKAMKIERLLELERVNGPVRVLEIGTGSGGIAHYFATHPRLDCDVEAIDVKDNRVIREGFGFQIVSDTHLPFPDGRFDLVISNHVIEHVGLEADQRHHLDELRRVLAPAGVGYLAVPNRWMVVEPHYKIAFLSWLPRRWRSPYLRLRGKGAFYDCEPLEIVRLEKMLAATGFSFRNLCIEALRATFEIERPSSTLGRALSSLPDFLLAPWRPLIPTLIYRLTLQR